MKPPEQTKSIEVFYDGRCGMCCTFHEWINRQPLSKVFFRRKDKVVRETLHQMETPGCETGFCPTK